MEGSRRPFAAVALLAVVAVLVCGGGGVRAQFPPLPSFPLWDPSCATVDSQEECLSWCSCHWCEMRSSANASAGNGGTAFCLPDTVLCPEATIEYAACDMALIFSFLIWVVGCCIGICVALCCLFYYCIVTSVSAFSLACLIATCRSIVVGCFRVLRGAWVASRRGVRSLRLRRAQAKREDDEQAARMFVVPRAAEPRRGGRRGKAVEDSDADSDDGGGQDGGPAGDGLPNTARVDDSGAVSPRPEMPLRVESRRGLLGSSFISRYNSALVAAVPSTIDRIPPPALTRQSTAGYVATGLSDTGWASPPPTQQQQQHPIMPLMLTVPAPSAGEILCRPLGADVDDASSDASSDASNSSSSSSDASAFEAEERLPYFAATTSTFTESPVNRSGVAALSSPALAGGAAARSPSRQDFSVSFSSRSGSRPTGQLFKRMPTSTS